VVTAISRATLLLPAVTEKIERIVVVDRTAPTLQETASLVYITQGGIEAVTYDVNDKTASSGVVWTSADGKTSRTFPGYPLGGSDTARFALFALPYDDNAAEEDVKNRLHVFATDDVGNTSKTTFVDRVFPRPMKTDTITWAPPFLKKIQPLAPQKSGDLLTDGLAVNRDLRRINNAFIVTLSKQTAPKWLFIKEFEPFGNAAIKGNFADRRTYMYEGKNVDTQDHLGFDLARTERAPVNVGNDGIVIFAGDLGIYGNCVVVDHGYGVMSLYAHLSSIGVAVGASIARGAILGNTGATGLAGGDHLHFTTLLHGLPVNPIEWWDAHFLEDRLHKKLGASFPFSPR
jgi:murein DD-endopeptidase MepM/ murein hydrolase activator NlpD